MPRTLLKELRVIVALAMLAGLTAALVDFRGLLPVQVGHWLASAQLVPSSVALVTGAALSVACIIIVVVTVAVGRVYCSAICPLGILQDVIARVFAWGRRREGPLLPYARPWTWLRQLVFWVSVAGVAAGGAGVTLALLDPYSNFGRIASGLFRPGVTLANNLVVGPANALGLRSLYRVEPPWAGGAALHQPALVLLLIVVLVALRGRLYCNTLCPVGTLLGMLARRAAARLAINQPACSKCGDCLHVCKAQCIDLRTKRIDFSRCVACYNCVSACPERGIGYRFTWKRQPVARPVAPASGQTALSTAEPGRRAFLAGTGAAVAASLGGGSLLRATVQALPAGRSAGTEGNQREPEPSRAICPPGAHSVDRFLERCTACHLCVTACPTHVLRPSFLEYGMAGVMMPRLDFTQAACNYTCRACGEACPDGAISLLDLADKQLTRIGQARFDEEKCIVKAKGTDCAACSEQCPTQAVTTVPYGRNLRLPQLNRDLCIGCGGCEHACPVQPLKAIVVIGHRRHSRAMKAVGKKAAAPRPAGDFPF
ncbi:MAG TPA: 4Fe-4S dicluster domain-containing protein [Opitutaceae bacterium]|nr:4Fe-4S dicluster domain-containing protein [Opitutaceae bacterium]